MYCSWKSYQVNFTECFPHWQDCTFLFHPSILQQSLRVDIFSKSGECAHWTSMWHFYWYRNATFRILHSYCATPISSSILSTSQLCNSVHKVLSREFGKKEKEPCHCETQATWTPQPELFILSWKYTWLLFSLAALRLLPLRPGNLAQGGDRSLWGAQVLTRDSVLDISSAVQCARITSHCRTGCRALMCFVLLWNSTPAPSYTYAAFAAVTDTICIWLFKYSLLTAPSYGFISVFPSSR